MSRRHDRRAVRRAHRDRARDRARQVLRSQDVRGEDLERLIPKVADHLAGCSCPGCGNPRRHYGERSVQERRAAQDDGE